MSSTLSAVRPPDPAPSKRKINKQAGKHIRRLRINRGLSPEQLGVQIKVSGRTIRRVEEEGMVPTARVMFALAAWTGDEVVDLWRL